MAAGVKVSDIGLRITPYGLFRQFDLMSRGRDGHRVAYDNGWTA